MDLHNLTAMRLISAGAIVGTTSGAFTYVTFNLIGWWMDRREARKAARAQAQTTTPENMWEQWRSDLDKVALGRTIQPVTAENESIRLVYVPSTGGTSLRIFSGPGRFTAWAAPDDLQELAAPLYPALHAAMAAQIANNRAQAAAEKAADTTPLLTAMLAAQAAVDATKKPAN